MKELLYYWGDMIVVNCTFEDPDHTEMAFRLEHRGSSFELSFVTVDALYGKGGRPRRWHALGIVMLGWDVATNDRVRPDLNWSMVPWPPHVPVRDILTKVIENAATSNSLPAGLPETALANVTPVRAIIGGRNLAEGLLVALVWYLLQGYTLDQVCGLEGNFGEVAARWRNQLWLVQPESADPESQDNAGRDGDSC